MGMEVSKPTEKSQLFVKTSAHLFSDVFMSVPYWFVIKQVCFPLDNTLPILITVGAWGY